MTQAELADAVGLTEISINRIENGKQGLTQTNLQAIGEALGVHPPSLYEPPPEGTRALRADESAQVGSISIKKNATNENRARAQGPIQHDLVSNDADLPIYASAQGGETGMTMTYEPIDWAKRPEPLRHVSTGFGMYVVGDSMEPAFRQGDMILVHPNRPANAGDDVLVVKSNGNNEHAALVKTLVASNTDEIKLKQYNPLNEFSVPRAEIHAVYLIVGKYSRR